VDGAANSVVGATAKWYEDHLRFKAGLFPDRAPFELATLRRDRLEPERSATRLTVGGGQAVSFLPLASREALQGDAAKGAHRTVSGGQRQSARVSPTSRSQRRSGSRRRSWK
jgi:hypothetical protein